MREKVLLPISHVKLDVVLPRPEAVALRSISLFVMAKNAESCIGRLLENVGPYIDEVVVVLNDTVDKSRAIIEDYCRAHSKDLILEEVTRASHPQFYILDTKATYEVGRTLCNEVFAGPFTEEPILARWSEARNLGWKKCTRRWRLFLDADDLVLDPEAIPGLCQVLDEKGAEQANTTYFFEVDTLGRPKGASLRERLVRNLPHINWIYDIHEVVSGTFKIAHVGGNLVVRDMRDNTGQNTRIPGRNFKVLYQQARANDWDVSARTLVNLLMEVRHQISGDQSMFDFAEKLLEVYLQRSTWQEERGWACCITAEMFERRGGLGDLERAVMLYKQSLDEHENALTSWLLCRAYFRLEQWQNCVQAYETGLGYKAVHQILSDGPLHEDMSKILVAASYNELGRYDEALGAVEAALTVWPSNLALAALRDKIRTNICLTVGP